MFTVLIAEKEHIDAIRQENKLFFEPFLENKELAFCQWNPEGQCLADAVPGLQDAVGRTKKWRVVILNKATAQQLKQQNPFDVVDDSPLTDIPAPRQQPEDPKEGESWEDLVNQWENQWKDYFEKAALAKEGIFRDALRHPLQKLATWLCFRPEDYILREVQEKQDVFDWAMEQMEDWNKTKPSARLERMERNRYKADLQKKELLRRELVEEKYLNIAYPAEVHCISPRTADTTFFNPDNYWTSLQESDYSTFADRNMYFDKMRFMVFDLLAQTHRNYRNDYIRFLASVLIFVTNPVPASAMQARRLYQLEVETDDAPLCTMVTSYDRKLAATSEVIDGQMEKIRNEIPGELTDKAAESLFCTPKDVPVVLDESCDPDKVMAELDYGLFFNVPENEFHKWNRDYEKSKKALAYIAKQQVRSIRKSVTQSHLASDVSDVNISRLTPLQIDDVREYTDNAENEMVDSIPPDMTDISRYNEKLHEGNEKVREVVSQRMRAKTVFGLGGICLVLYLICFLPFLFSDYSTPKSVITAILLVGVTLGALAVIMFVTLLFLRASVRNAVRGYNEKAKEILNEIQSTMRRFSQYLSAFCNVRRGHSVQNYASKNVDIYTKSLRIRKRHQEDIRKRRAYLAEQYGDYLAGSDYCDETMSRPYEYDFDQRMEYTYPAPFLAGDSRQIEFISSGNYVTVPSSYVTSILVRMEGLYEK